MSKLIVYGLGKRGQDFIQALRDVPRDMELVAVTDTYVKEAASQAEEG